MNDFTKEDLKDIIDCINYAYRSSPLPPKIHLVLSYKIKTMIDNYCEHENVTYCSDCVTETCIKCKKRW